MWLILTRKGPYGFRFWFWFCWELPDIWVETYEYLTPLRFTEGHSKPQIKVKHIGKMFKEESTLGYVERSEWPKGYSTLSDLIQCVPPLFTVPFHYVGVVDCVYLYNICTILVKGSWFSLHPFWGLTLIYRFSNIFEKLFEWHLKKETILLLHPY